MLTDDDDDDDRQIDSSLSLCLSVSLSRENEKTNKFNWSLIQVNLGVPAPESYNSYSAHSSTVITASCSSSL